MTPDLIHDYEYNLKNALSRVNNDPTLRDEDRRLLLAFLEHIKALRVSTGRQAKYANMLRTASHMLRVPWRRAKRKDIDGPHDEAGRPRDRQQEDRGGAALLR